MKRAILSIALWFAATVVVITILWAAKIATLSDMDTPVIAIVLGLSAFAIITTALLTIKLFTKINTTRS